MAGPLKAATPFPQCGRSPLWCPIWRGLCLCSLDFVRIGVAFGHGFRYTGGRPNDDWWGVAGDLEGCAGHLVGMQERDRQG